MCTEAIRTNLNRIANTADNLEGVEDEISLELLTLPREEAIKHGRGTAAGTGDRGRAGAH